MSRFRLGPTGEQEVLLTEHCRHARFVWNLAVEQHAWWTPRRGPAPGFVQQARQLTEARAECRWLAAGAQMVQQQALRDFAQAMTAFFAGTHRRPTWRKAGVHEGFRIVAVQARDVRRLSRRTGAVRVPKVGWVRFRWSRRPPRAKSYRITRDRAGRWHLAFAALPTPIAAPGSGATIGVDRGVAVSAALSNGELLRCPTPTPSESARLVRLQRRLSKAEGGSGRRRRIRCAIARLKARQADRRKDWLEKTSTSLARSYDRIAFEALDVVAMTRRAQGTGHAPRTGVAAKAGLNRSIRLHAWGGLVERTKDKAPGRVVLVPAAYTSRRCSVCGHVAAENRESQATFACRNCGHRGHADVNAAVNIDAAVNTATAAGRAVVLRGEGTRVTGPMSREPQRDLSSFLGETSGNPPLAGWRTSNRDYLHTGLAEGGEGRRVR
ncbi:RNA-guided endonuclease TnpB family protein [Streptomyces aculeolatus]|uniref:RNA-guided endonuclease InsQ/TnpB family protein n=1 Tax=Streptomyces aculeolatus TaxID=270689 RepID=UPI001CEC127D|nr:RNA-guided endonuclease TnpB family protein [Streptomyces aculeolatus]